MILPSSSGMSIGMSFCLTTAVGAGMVSYLLRWQIFSTKIIKISPTILTLIFWSRRNCQPSGAQKNGSKDEEGQTIVFLTMVNWCQSKHVRLITKCYPPRTANPPKPNSSELSYLTYYAYTTPSKLKKVGRYLEHRARAGLTKGRTRYEVL